jgi:hypothetical protein
MAKRMRSRRPPVIPPINRTLRPFINRAALPQSDPSANTPMARATLWVIKHATQQEKSAYFRVIRDFANKTGKRMADSYWLNLIGDPLELQPGDADILEQMRNRMPEDVRNDMRF